MIGGAREQFTVAGLTILGKYRKRQRLVDVLEAMKRLKTLKETDQRLRELFEEENYVGAIMMCTECQHAAASFRQYRCISDLANKLHDTMVVIEQQLDNALASMTLRIDLERYGRVVAAYEMIGKMNVAANAVVIHFMKSISNAYESIVAAYCGNADANGGDGDSRPALTEAVPPGRLVECLREVLRVFWRIWLGYHTLFLWHVERPVLTPHCGQDSEDRADDDYVETAFDQGLNKLWLESMSHLSRLIQSGNLNTLKMDQFLSLIDLAKKVSVIGQRHFKSGSGDLENTLREKSVEYLKHHHHHSLDELAMFLETEAWEPVPVRRHFSYKDLPEFGFLLQNNDFEIVYQPENGNMENPARLPTWEFMAEGNCLTNPFEVDVGVMEDDKVNGAGTEQTESDDSDVPEELKQDYIDEAAYENNTQRPIFKRHESFKPVDSMQPVLSNVALTMLRLWGRSLQAAHSLPSISFEVIVLLAQLFDYYFLAIYRYFGTDSGDYGVEYKSSKLSQALQRIEQWFPEIGKELPRNRSVSLVYADRLFGLAQRIVAVESLIFVSKQLDSLRSLLERLVPSTKVAFISQFYSQTLSVVPEMRRAVYGAVASKSLNYDRLLDGVISVNWELNELMSQHSEYVDFLIQDLNNLRLRLSELARTAQIPKETCVILWEFCIQIIGKLLVEGYSSARKCTNEGRALMMLDFQQLLSVMEKISNLRPLPYRDFVESYIKAYYLPETSLEPWIKERKEYSPKQLIGLLNVMSHIGRKTRQRLIAFLSGNPDDS